MNQTFIDMLVAIKDPVAIEKAYNIMAAKRELLVGAAGKGVGKSKFQHTVMEPRPVPKTYSMTRIRELEAEEQKGDQLIRLKNTTKAMRRNGFHDGMVFKFFRNTPSGKVEVRHVRSGRHAIVDARFLESFTKKPWDGRSPTECNCPRCIFDRRNSF